MVMLKAYRILAPVLGLAALLVANAADAEPTSVTEAGQARSGFALQTSFVTLPFTFESDVIGFNTFEGGLMFGYKANRVVVGVGFDFTKISESHDTTGDPSPIPSTSSNFTFIVSPEVQVALARSADERAELTGVFGLGVGTWGSDDADDNATRLRLRWRIAPGVRYWVHPRIGVSLVSGIMGNHLIMDRSGSTLSVSIASLYSQIGLMGVF